ncbi:hypothetical protein M404DRAFT_113550, partial [Pisolithus tinctorius Marx 270]
MTREGQLPGIDTLTGELEFCEPCTTAKMKKLPFKPTSECMVMTPTKGPCTTQPFQMVHTDVGGPITPASREGYQYWVVIVDGFTCFP